MFRIVRPGPPTLALSTGNKKRKRGVSVETIALVDLPTDVLTIIFKFALFSYIDAAKMRPVCSLFWLTLKRIAMYKRFVYLELRDILSPKVIVGICQEDTDYERVYKARYKYVPYLQTQPVLRMSYRSQIVTLFRIMAFDLRMKLWPSGFAMPYVGRVVAFHRAVSVFDRFCIATKEQLSYRSLRPVLCACSFLGFACNTASRKGHWYLDNHMQLLEASGWTLTRIDLVRAVHHVKTVLTRTSDPRARGDGLIHSFAIPHEATRSLFYKSTLNHKNDFHLISEVMRCLSKNDYSKECYYMCMYVVDLVLQTELVFSPDVLELARAVYIYAWHAFPSMFPLVWIFADYGGMANTRKVFLPYFRKFTQLRKEAKAHNKYLHQQYGRWFYRSVSVEAPESPTF